MKVIFTENVPGVGSKGDIKNVKPGFFRNYLLPLHKGVLATGALEKKWEERRKQLLIEKQELKAKLEEAQKRLASSKLLIHRKVTKKGTLYGGIKPPDIAQTIKEQLHVEIPEAMLIIEKPIKAIGTYQITLNLGEGVQTNVTLEVVEKKES